MLSSHNVIRSVPERYGYRWRRHCKTFAYSDVRSVSLTNGHIGRACHLPSVLPMCPRAPSPLGYLRDPLEDPNVIIFINEADLAQMHSGGHLNWVMTNSCPHLGGLCFSTDVFLKRAGPMTISHATSSSYCFQGQSFAIHQKPPRPTL